MRHLSSFVFLLFTLCPKIMAFAGRLHASERFYSRAHFLGNDFTFDSRDGWHNISISNLDYKYRRDTKLHLHTSKGGSPPTAVVASVHHIKKPVHHGLGKVISDALGGVLKGLKALGRPEKVIITWYTGNDLLRPSCWPTNKWAPTDKSFVAALTLEGWKDRPKCFEFLQLCNKKKKCIFVRVVDTCAGCAPGTKHVDLTKAAFGQLADFDEGILHVQLRQATKPKSVWFEHLWGPKD